MNDLFTFIYAVLKQWIVLMSGVVSIAFMLVLRARGRDISNKIFWLVAALCLSVACFLAWRDVRGSLKKVEQELAEAKNPNLPKLSGQIEEVAVRENTDPRGSQVFIRLSVRNLGAQSIAEKFALRIKSEDFDYSARPTELPEQYTLAAITTSKTILRRQDAIDKKTLEPIQPGSVEHGWLRFVVPEVEPVFIHRPGMKYTVSFVDVMGKTCSAEYVMPGTAK